MTSNTHPDRTVDGWQDAPRVDDTADDELLAHEREVSDTREAAFMSALNDSYVVYVPDLSYDWPDAELGQSGWEAASPFGEIRAFRNRGEAEKWRMAEVRKFAKSDFT